MIIIPFEYLPALQIEKHATLALVLQQHRFGGYRAIQNVQAKARVAGNGHSLVKTLNAVLDVLGCSLRASQKAVIHVVALLVKGVTIPFKTRLLANCFLTRCTHQTYVVGVLESGAQLFAWVEDGRLIMESKDQLWQSVHSACDNVSAAGTDLAQALINERRVEAQRENR